MSKQPDFTGSAPAQKKRKKEREELGDELEDKLGRVFKKAKKKKKGAVATCPDWGDDDEADLAEQLLNAKTTSETRSLSEQLGEDAGVYTLQNALSQKNIPYDDDCLHVFNGPNVFNMVYVYPDLKKPEGVIVLETKGGSSQCGWRNSHLHGGQVKQGTPEYFETEADVMANSSKPDVSEVGTAIQSCLGQNKVVYAGVRAPYNKKKGEVYDPEVFFVQDM